MICSGRIKIHSDSMSSQQDKNIPKETTDEKVIPSKKTKPRCHCCNKKLKMTELQFKCKCGNVYCKNHLNPHSHMCSFDYLQERREIIKDKNPQMCIQRIEVL